MLEATCRRIRVRLGARGIPDPHLGPEGAAGNEIWRFQPGRGEEAGRPAIWAAKAERLRRAQGLKGVGSRPHPELGDEVRALHRGAAVRVVHRCFQAGCAVSKQHRWTGGRGNPTQRGRRTDGGTEAVGDHHGVLAPVLRPHPREGQAGRLGAGQGHAVSAPLISQRRGACRVCREGDRLAGVKNGEVVRRDAHPRGLRHLLHTEAFQPHQVCRQLGWAVSSIATGHHGERLGPAQLQRRPGLALFPGNRFPSAQLDPDRAARGEGEVDRVGAAHVTGALAVPHPERHRRPHRDKGFRGKPDIELGHKALAQRRLAIHVEDRCV